MANLEPHLEVDQEDREPPIFEYYELRGGKYTLPSLSYEFFAYEGVYFSIVYLRQLPPTTVRYANGLQLRVIGPQIHTKHRAGGYPPSNGMSRLSIELLRKRAR